MSDQKLHFPWFGIVLILMGGILLLNKLSVIEFSYAQIFFAFLMLLGVIKVGQGFSRNVSARIFWGTLLFMYALYFLLRSMDFLEVRMHMFMPATFLIFGTTFFMMYLNNFKEWVLLIPALLLIGVGGAFILSEMGYLYQWEVWEAVRLYWPIGLIIIGIAIILRHRMSTQPPQTSQ